MNMLARVMLMLLFAAGPLAAEVSDGQLIHFQVADAGTGELLYQGVERITVRSGKVSKHTVYRALDEKEVMVEQVSYELDSLKVDEFVSEHPVSGEVMTLQRKGSRLDISYVERRGQKAQRNEELLWEPETRIGKTVHHIIVRNWDSLLAGEARRFKLLVPSRFASYDFQLVYRPSSDGGFVFRLQPGSWLLRAVVAPMDFHYDAGKRAVKYVGPTTVGYYDDPDRKVEIRFSY